MNQVRQEDCRLVVAGAVLLAMSCTGCSLDMADQPRYEPLEASDFFSDRMSARPPLPGTIARGHLPQNESVYRDLATGKLVDTLPVELDRALLERGKERFEIFCSHCHDRTGSGNGMAVQRGFPAPPSFHIDRLRAAPAGHFFDVITNGIGRMPQHGTLIPPKDRWAIAAYIRTLQYSQHAATDKLTADDISQLSKDEQ